MPMTYQRRESFPAGTPEERVVQEQRLRLAGGAMVSAYTGSEGDGWTLITTWDLFREHGEAGRRERPAGGGPFVLAQTTSLARAHR